MSAAFLPLATIAWPLSPSWYVVTGRGSSGWVVDARPCGRIRHAHLALQAIRIAEEETQGRTEVGDEPVATPPGYEALTDHVERVEGCRSQPEVVDPAAPEHRRLPLGLGVSVDLKDIELGGRPDVDERQAHPGGLDMIERDRRVEDLPVEHVQPVGVTREDRDVVDPVQQHRALPIIT